MTEKSFLHFRNISFCYPSQNTFLFAELSHSFFNGWYGIIGVNGSGKTTLLSLAAKILTPTGGSIHSSETPLYCPQRTDHPSPDHQAFFQDYDFDSLHYKTLFAIPDDWAEKESFYRLSHGERKRLQLAIALWKNPGILAIDEPTNHLDHQTKEMVIEGLKNYRGIGLIVSHDRELLDTLCSKCVFLEPPNAIIRNGNYTQTLHCIEEERQAKRRQFETIKKEVKRIDKEVKKRRHEAMRSDARVSKKNIDKSDHDAKAKIDLARVSGKDGVAGKLLNQLGGRFEQLQQQKKELAINSEISYGIEILGEVSKRDYLIKIDHPFTLEVGDKLISYKAFELLAQDRLAICGRNGSGKTTLIKHLIALIQEQTASSIRFHYLPQEISEQESREQLERIKKLPSAELGALLSFFKRLGSDPKQLLMGQVPSPGEMRKLLLSQIVLLRPHLLILDEPTNHLDLLSIELLESALEGFSGALIVISHDQHFIKKLTTKVWKICTNF